MNVTDAQIWAFPFLPNLPKPLFLMRPIRIFAEQLSDFKAEKNDNYYKQKNNILKYIMQSLKKLYF